MKVKSAQHLPKVDTIGWIDAYCQCQVVHKDDDPSKQLQGKTRIVKKEENPKWDEDMKLAVDNPAARFELTLFDWERFHDDRPVGYLEVPIDQLVGQGGKVQTYNLKKADKSGLLSGPNGQSTIDLELEFQPGESMAEMEELRELEKQMQEEKKLEEEARERLRAAQVSVHLCSQSCRRW